MLSATQICRDDDRLLIDYGVLQAALSGERWVVELVERTFGFMLT